MEGVDWRVLSRTIALCCEYWLTMFGSWFPACPLSPARRLPRSYSCLVIVWNAFVPLPVNCRVTSGWPVSVAISAWMPDSTRSLPVSSGGPPAELGLYLNRYQYVLSVGAPVGLAPMQPFLIGQAIAMRPAGVVRIWVFCGFLPPYGRSSSSRVGAEPGARSLCFVTVFSVVTVLPLTFFFRCLTTFRLRKSQYCVGVPFFASPFTAVSSP